MNYLVLYLVIAIGMHALVHITNPATARRIGNGWMVAFSFVWPLSVSLALFILATGRDVQRK